MSFALCLIFALSGASALIFETLWFRGASLTFGNSVWASSLVLASFMAGLGIGNAAAARWGARLARPVRAYALLEVVIAGTGLALVWILPALANVIAPLLRPFVDVPWLLNGLRLALALVLLLVPSVAMGATLPLLADALHARDAHFGRVLGRLYGWNTLGAVVGSVAGELLLIRALGVHGSAAVAAGLNLLAASGALALSARLSTPREAATRAPDPHATRARLSPRARRALLAAGLAGFALLGLEVVWFRFLLLFVNGTSLAFAILLAVVLLGIALGGLLAGPALAAGRSPAGRLAPLALVAGALGLLSYALFPLTLARIGGALVSHPTGMLALAVPLMFPVALCSGLLFPWIGALLQREIGGASRATGLLTLANTAGAALGPLVAGFVLLPGIGIERSIVALSAVYVAVAALTFEPATAPRRVPRLAAAAALAFLAVLAVFPFGLMKAGFLEVAVNRYRMRPDARVVAVREGLTETIQYLETPRFGGPWFHQLVTNGISMSGNSFAGQRYMKLFVYLPVALHPEPKSALLVSFGVGSTAKALTDTRELETIDVVDISEEILDLASVVFPDPATNPLHDPRVSIHVEDGRHFLQTTDRRFDLITSEPPPPKSAGVVNLYTREYFELLRERLNEGGMVSYWLPMHVLTDDDGRAILRAFCDAFPDCSLWHGFSLDYLLLGTRDARGPVSEARFRAQWEDPTVAAALRATGVERPEQLAALFIADADELARIAGDAPPLTDDWPKRLDDARGDRDPWAGALPNAFVDAGASRDRFARSRTAATLVPPGVREAAPPWFAVQQRVNDLGMRRTRSTRPPIADFDDVLRGTDLETLPLWLLGSDADEQRLARQRAASGASDGELQWTLGVGALAERRYDEAATRLARAAPDPSAAPAQTLLRAYALCRAGRPAEARALAPPAVNAGATPPPAWAWLLAECTPAKPGDPGAR